MARGGYGALASGLESGFNLGLRQDEFNESKRARGVQEALQQRAATRADDAEQRQANWDAVKASSEGLQMQTSEMEGHLARAGGDPSKIPLEILQGLTEKRKAAVAAHQQLLQRFLPQAKQEEQSAKDLFSNLQAGNTDISKVPPDQLYRAVVATTRRPMSDFMPGANGEPSPVSKGLQDFQTGQSTGNQKMMLDGVNALFAPELKVGVGQPGAHGGTIVGKKIVGLAPAPTDPNNPDDPRKGHVVPVVRVYESSADPSAGIAEQHKAASLEQQQYGAPAGATGHYDSLLTQNRSSDPNDPVRTVNIEDAIDRAHRLGSVASMMQNPQFASLMKQGEQGGKAPADAFLSAFFAGGGKMPTKQETAENVNLGGVTARIHKDAQGHEIPGSREMLQHVQDPNKVPAALRTKEGLLSLLDPNSPTYAEDVRAITTGIKPTAMSLAHAAAGLSPDENAALFGPRGAVTQGRLDMNRVNSRTAKLFANAEMSNPGQDFAGMSADIQLGRNATFRQRAMIAEQLPTVMQNMVEAGKKLNFSDAKFLGEAEAWLRGQTNDPEFISYMAQRNDALMTIAGVMRGVGMTDQAHRAEIEVSQPTMSPRALDAWYDAQMKSLQPRLDQYRKITSSRGQQGGINASLASDLPTNSAGHPSVPPGQQAGRDNDAVTVLQDELVKEQAKLPGLTGDDLTRKQADIAALQREIAKTSGGRSAPRQPAASVAAPRRISSDAEFNSLPSGTLFVGPDGKTRRKP